jgi:hypothetical protein
MTNRGKREKERGGGGKISTVKTFDQEEDVEAAATMKACLRELTLIKVTCING